MRLSRCLGFLWGSPGRAYDVSSLWIAPGDDRVLELLLLSGYWYRQGTACQTLFSSYMYLGSTAVGYVGTEPHSPSQSLTHSPWSHGSLPPAPARRRASCAGHQARKGAGVGRSPGPRQERPPGDGGRRPWVSPQVVSIREYTYRTHYACGTRHLSAGRALKGSRMGQRQSKRQVYRRQVGI